MDARSCAGALGAARRRRRLDASRQARREQRRTGCGLLHECPAQGGRAWIDLGRPQGSTDNLIYPGIVVPSGRYVQPHTVWRFNTDRKKALLASVWLTWTRNNISLPQRDFVANLASLRVAFNVSTTRSIESLKRPHGSLVHEPALQVAGSSGHRAVSRPTTPKGSTARGRSTGPSL